MAERFSCSALSRSLGEPCHATASQVRRWILVEQPGAWGANAVLQSGLPTDVATRLRAVARAVGARLLLIRRHGRSNPTDRVCFAVTSTADVRRVERFSFVRPGQLLEIDWTPLREFAPVGGELVDDPLYLVCTNGSHDTCCATFGRPVAKILATEVGDQLWESSHFGGDRFAGNLVCLPDGIYYGRVSTAHAYQLVSAHRAGTLHLECYRGRSFQPFAAQAAEQFVRTERDLVHVDQVIPRAVADLGDGRFEVAVDIDGEAPAVATVECSDSPDAQQLTCQASGEEHPPRYRLVDLR